ncbi:hypothetical protein D3C73_1242010 [compost metagenome]
MLRTRLSGLLDDVVSFLARILERLLLLFYISDRLLPSLRSFVNLLLYKFAPFLHYGEQGAECVFIEQEIQNKKSDQRQDERCDLKMHLGHSFPVTSFALY